MFKEADVSNFAESGKDVAECVQYEKGPVFFLLTRKGEAIEIHIKAIGRRGRLLIREASRAVIEWVGSQYPWCRMLIAPVSSRSVYNLCIKVGFFDAGYGLFEKGIASVMVKRYEVSK